jgi:hypothetical protein
MAVSANSNKTGLGAPYAGSGTYAQMKAISSPQDGASFQVTGYANFTPKAAQTWRYSVANSDWFPIAPALIYEATPLTNGLVQTAAQILLAMPVDAGVLVGKTFFVKSTQAKSGTTDTITPALRMGSAGTVSDTQVSGLNTIGAQRSIGQEMWFRMASNTSVVRLGGLPYAPFSGTAGTVLLANVATTIADVSAANYVSISCTMSGTTDTPQIGYTGLWVMP